MDDPFPVGMVEEIEKFLATDSQRPPGKDIYEEVFNTSMFFPLQRQQELIQMIRIARAINPRTVMEIGADKGGGLYHWCKSLTTVKNVIACEIRGCPYQHAFNKTFPHINFFWMERASLPPPRLPELQIDVLFIDGDKSFMVADFDAYLPMMNPRGVVFIHDIQDSPGPRDAFLNIKARGYRTHAIINTDDYLKLRGKTEPPATAHEGWLRHWRGRSCGVGVVYLEGNSK